MLHAIQRHLLQQPRHHSCDQSQGILLTTRDKENIKCNGPVFLHVKTNNYWNNLHKKKSINFSSLQHLFAVKLCSLDFQFWVFTTYYKKSFRDSPESTQTHIKFWSETKNWLTKCSFESIEALSHAIPQISHGKKSFCLKSTTPRTIIWNDKVLIRRFFESSSCKKQLPSGPCQTARPIIHPKVLHNNNVR